MKAKKTKRPRPKMPHTSEEMKQWSAMLGNELSAWPQVATRPMFGLRGFYRGRKISVSYTHLTLPTICSV